MTMAVAVAMLVDSQPFYPQANSCPGVNRHLEPWPIREMAWELSFPVSP